MTRTIRSRRAESAAQPLYARMLRLRHLAPSGLLCFVFLEGAVVLGILLALAELVSWWGVLVLPITVAVMVKFNDLVAGTFVQPAGPSARPATARASVLRPAAMPAAEPHPPATSPSESFSSAMPQPSDGSFSSAMPQPSGGSFSSAVPQSSGGPFSAAGPQPPPGGLYASAVPQPPPEGPDSAAGSFSAAESPGAWRAHADRFGDGIVPDRAGNGYANAGFRPAHPMAGREDSAGNSDQPVAGAPPAAARPGAMPVNDYARASYGQAQGEDAATRAPSAGGGGGRRAWADEWDVREQMARQAAVRRYE